LPFLILTAGLGLIDRTLPNTSVPTRAAIAGGLAAGLLLQLNNMASAVYFSQVLSYSKVYGSLGAVPVLMVGLYLSWMIVLIGAEVAYAAATPLSATAPLPEGGEARGRIALEVARVVAASFLAGRGGVTPAEISRELAIPVDWVLLALRRAADAGLFLAAASDGDELRARYLPARPPDRIAALDVVQAMASPREEAEASPRPSAAVAEFLARRLAVERENLGGVTLEALARDLEPEAR
jgi:membrane protein